jgi:hypothetical protein
MIKNHRLTILVLVIAGLSTAFITVPITSRKAHALSFDAKVIGHPGNKAIYYNEKTDKVNTIFDFEKGAIDFWLNVPSEAGAEDNFETYNFKSLDSLYAYLGAIDLKGNPLPTYIYDPPEDLFDPSQAVIKRYIFNFGVIAFILTGMMILICAGFVFLDKYAFRIALQNCSRSGNNISWDRTKREIRHYSRFVLKVLMIIVLFISFNATLLYLCHEHIVPIPTVIKIFSYFDSNPVVWEKNIEIGKFGDIGEEYEEWSKEQGFSPETGRFWQEFLWHNWYILIAIILYFGFSFYFSVFKFSLKMFMRYKMRLMRRRGFYYAVDRHRLVKKTEEIDQPECSDNNFEIASKKGLT